MLKMFVTTALDHSKLAIQYWSWVECEVRYLTYDTCTARNLSATPHLKGKNSLQEIDNRNAFHHCPLAFS